jgi:hypothetical protein
MNLLRASANRLSACVRALTPWFRRTLLPLRCSIQADGKALPSSSHAERPVQGSRRQEYWAADARGPRAQQAGKLETRLLLSRSQGGTVARARRDVCRPHNSLVSFKRGQNMVENRHVSTRKLKCVRVVIVLSSNSRRRKNPTVCRATTADGGGLSQPNTNSNVEPYRSGRSTGSAQLYYVQGAEEQPTS